MCVAAFPAIGALGTGATSGLFALSLGLNAATALAQRSAAQAAANQTYQSSLIANRSAEQAFAAQQEALAAQLKESTANFRESINQALESASRQYTRNVRGLEAQRDNRRNQLTSNINQAYNQIPTLGSVLLNTAVQGLTSYAGLTAGLGSAASGATGASASSFAPSGYQPIGNYGNFSSLPNPFG